MGCLQRLHDMPLKSLALGVVHRNGIRQLSRLRSQQTLKKCEHFWCIYGKCVCVCVCVTVDMYMRMCKYVHLCV